MQSKCTGTYRQTRVGENNTRENMDQTGTWVHVVVTRDLRLSIIHHGGLSTVTAGCLDGGARSDGAPETVSVNPYFQAVVEQVDGHEAPLEGVCVTSTYNEQSVLQQPTGHDKCTVQCS